MPDFPAHKTEVGLPSSGPGLPRLPLKKKKKPKTKTSVFPNSKHFVYIQSHLHWSDTSFSLEDLFQLLSSQPEHSLEVKGTLTGISHLILPHPHTPKKTLELTSN